MDKANKCSYRLFPPHCVFKAKLTIENKAQVIIPAPCFLLSAVSPHHSQQHKHFHFMNQ